MIEIRVDDKHIVLKPDAAMDIDLANTLFTKGIEDSFSMPVDMPVHGNEQALEQVHQLAMANRRNMFRTAGVAVDGAPLFQGDLQVVASSPDAISASFAVDAFATRIKGLLLPDLMAGPDVQLHVNDDGTGKVEPRPAYADGGDCQFPMHYNPSLYGDENPNWAPDHKEWKPGTSYAVNELVAFTSHQLLPDHPIQRTTYWQCISAAYANESPVTHPAKWRRTAFGIVNAWDHENGSYYYNTAGSYYSFVPWFYWKWVIARALGAVGLQAAGEFMRDTRTHEFLLPNPNTIDAPRTTGLHFFRASHDGDVIYTDDTAWFRLPGTDDSTPPNQDTDGSWDTSTSEFLCQYAGTWRFTCEYTIAMERLKYSNQVGRVALLASDGTERAASTFDPLDTYALQWSVAYVDNIECRIIRWRTTIQVEMTAADVGHSFRFRPSVVHKPGYYVYYNWPQAAPDRLMGTTIVNGYMVQPVFVPQQPDTVVVPARHVPNVTLAAFLEAAKDMFGLEIVPDMENGRVELNYNRTAMDAMRHGVPDHTPRLAGPVTIHQADATPGIRLAWHMDDTVNELVQPGAQMTHYMHERQLPVPTAEGTRAVLLNTRELLETTFADNEFFWKPIGRYVPGVTIGDPKNPDEVVPTASPLHMDTMSIDGKPLCIPVLDMQGASLHFRTNTNFKDIHVAYYTATARGPSSTLIPGPFTPPGEVQGPQARSWGYAWNNSDVVQSLHWLEDSQPPRPVPAPDMYTTFHQPWVEMLTRAEPVELDLLLDIPFIKSGAWRRPILLNGQQFLVKNLPVSLHAGRAPLLATQTQALRIRHGVPDHVQEDFTTPPPPPETPPMFHFIAEDETYCVIVTTSGHYAVRNAAGTTVVYASNEFIILPTDEYWAWACDESGVHDGAITQLYAAGNAGRIPYTLFDVTSLHLLELLSVSYAALPQLQLDGNTLLQSINIYEVTLGELYMTHNTLIETCDILNTTLAEIIMPPGSAIKTLNIQDANNLSLLDITSLNELEILNITGTAISTLDITSNNAMQQIVVESNPALHTVTLPSLMPDIDYIYLDANNLSEASVDHVLHQALGYGMGSGNTIDLSGGTNASPSATGLSDKASLVSSGVTVNTN